jgi:hypothetical protein
MDVHILRAHDVNMDVYAKMCNPYYKYVVMIFDYKSKAFVFTTLGRGGAFCTHCTQRSSLHTKEIVR